MQDQMKKGPLIGFPIVGVKVTLTDGAYHDVDSSYMAFKIASMAALREVYPQAQPTALEPILPTYLDRYRPHGYYSRA